MTNSACHHVCRLIPKRRPTGDHLVQKCAGAPRVRLQWIICIPVLGSRFWWDVKGMELVLAGVGQGLVRDVVWLFENIETQYVVTEVEWWWVEHKLKLQVKRDCYVKVMKLNVAWYRCYLRLIPFCIEYKIDQLNIGAEAYVFIVTVLDHFQHLTKVEGHFLFRQIPPSP